MVATRKTESNQVILADHPDLILSPLTCDDCEIADRFRDCDDCPDNESPPNLERILRVQRIITRWRIDSLHDWDTCVLSFDQRLAGPRNTVRFSRMIESAGYTAADLTE